MKILESSENYLETIYDLQRVLGNVRSIDIARELNYSKPSITKAMSKLKALELITIDNTGTIKFTNKGSEYASKIINRHATIKEMLINCGVPEEIADADACKIEHVISQESIDVFEQIIKEKNKQ